MSLKILGASPSPFVRKIRMICAEKGLAYALEQVSPFAPPEGWRKISPLGKIPALDHDGKIINDSSVISAYLDRIAPEPLLIPEEPYAMARALWIEEFSDAGVMPIAGGQIFRPVCLQPLLTNKPVESLALEQAQKAFDEELAPLYAYLDEQLGDAGYFVGDALTIADISVACLLVNPRLAGFPPDPSRTPKLAAFTDRLHARPSLAALIEQDKAVFGTHVRWR